MLIKAYCAKSWLISTWRTVGVRPLTSPPLLAETINLEELKADIVYIRLHGLNKQPYLYSDPGMHTALSAAQVEQADFEGSMVFLEGCQGDEMAAAFRQAGARAVVGCDNSTWGRRWMMGPSSKVGKAWLCYVKQGMPADQALRIALNRVNPKYRVGWQVTSDQGVMLI